MIAKKDEIDEIDRSNQPGSRVGYTILIIALLALAVAGILIFRPFFVPLLLALIITSVSYPLYTLVRGWLGEKRASLASGVSCGLIVLVVLGPVSWLLAQLAAQASDARRSVGRQVEDLAGWRSTLEKNFGEAEVERFVDRLKRLFPPVDDPEKPLGGLAPVLVGPPLDTAGESAPTHLKLPKDWLGIAGSLASLAASILSGLLGTIVKGAIMVFLMFYFFRDGPRMLESVKAALPVEREYQDRIATTFKQISQSLLKGTILTAIVQGVVAGVAFLIVGVPAIIGGFAVAIAALVPFVGTGLVTVPVTLYLVAQSSYWQAILMAIVAAIIASLDNFLRPLLMREGLRLHPVWIFIALLGGAACFGPVGLLVGPMVVVLLRTFLAVVSEESQKRVAAGRTAA